MIRGERSISWGLEFSYPQLYQDPHTGEIVPIVEGERFPNTAPFRQLQRWMRRETRPTPFLVDGHRINAVARLGRGAFAWIDRHRQLCDQQLGVRVA